MMASCSKQNYILQSCGEFLLYMYIDLIYQFLISVNHRISPTYFLGSQEILLASRQSSLHNLATLVIKIIVLFIHQAIYIHEKMNNNKILCYVTQICNENETFKDLQIKISQSNNSSKALFLSKTKYGLKFFTLRSLQSCLVPDFILSQLNGYQCQIIRLWIQ